MKQAGNRPMRADARRNRAAILRAARAAFEADGIFAPLDGIATAAEVGNATLYRNFPTREDLLSAVIEDSVRDLLEQSQTYARELNAPEALREWLFRVTWGLRIWHDLPTCIATAHAHENPESPVQTVLTRLIERTEHFLAPVRAGGAAEVGAEEVFQLVTAVSWAVDRYGDDPPRARARVRLATAGVFLPAHAR